MPTTYEYVRDAVGDKEHVFKLNMPYLLKELKDYIRK
jgi:hypothetical protein